MRFILLAAALFAAAIPAAAQSPSKILQNAEKALGGKRALQSIRSWERNGTVSRVSDGATGRYSESASAPNLYHAAYDIGGFETEYAYNGRSGWFRNSREGLSTLTGDTSADLQAEAGFRNRLWLNYKRERAKIAAGGRSEVGGRPANVVLLSTPRGATLKLYFDAMTGLPLREEVPFGSETEMIEYGDYRMTQGVMQPYSIRLTKFGETLDIKIDSVKINSTIAVSRFAFPQAADQPLPDIPALLAELQKREDRVDEILDTYSYVQKITRRELGKDGVLRETGSETYQLAFFKGNRIRRLIERNGRPLSAKEQAEQDKEAAERVEEIEKRVAKQEARNGPPSGEGPRISIAEVLRASKLVNPRRERFKGRNVVVFDFEPNPNFDYKNAKSFLRFFGKTAGVMWIDEEDKQVARLEAYLADSFNIGGGLLAKLRRGATFTLEQERVNNEIWLPSMTDINLSVRVLLVRGVNVNQVVRSYDYQKFATEVKDAKVGETEKKQ